MTGDNRKLDTLVNSMAFENVTRGKNRGSSGPVEEASTSEKVP